MSVLQNIELWHQRARPQPDAKAFNVQLGCHLEEVAEMLEDLFGETGEYYKVYAIYQQLLGVSDALKSGEIRLMLPDKNRVNFLDSLADQIVTAVGVGHCAGMNVPEAAVRVNTSNWSKFVDGHPVFDANGKIAKPDTYVQPDLSGLY